MSIKIYLSDSVNPYHNLAMEDWIFHDMEDVDHVLFLWRNQETVVIGRFQNPWVECNLQKMKDNNVYLARRQSGGGAVYQDLGNTNFTFLSKKSAYNPANNFQIIINALSTFGLQASCHGRNDIVINNNDEVRKISGSAFKVKTDRAFHHGTLLLHANMSALATYLTPDTKKLQAKGVKSVRSRVINCHDIVSTINHENVSDEIIKQFKDMYNCEVQSEIVSPDSFQSFPGLRKRIQHHASDDWNLGKTLPFTHQLTERFKWGNIDIRFNVVGNTITTVQIFSDSLVPKLIEMLQHTLRGKVYSKDVCESLYNIGYTYKEYLDDICSLIRSEV